MKITSFNPLVATKNPEDAIKLFEELGFEKIHVHAVFDNSSNISMKDDKGHKIDISGPMDVPQDLTMIRMNVDDFDEAYEFLLAHGFVHKSGRIVEDDSSKSAMLTSPSGFAFDLAQHKK